MALTWNIDSWRKSIAIGTTQFLSEFESLRPPTKKLHTDTLITCITEAYRALPKELNVQQKFFKLALEKIPPDMTLTGQVASYHIESLHHFSNNKDPVGALLLYDQFAALWARSDQGRSKPLSDTPFIWALELRSTGFNRTLFDDEPAIPVAHAPEWVQHYVGMQSNPMRQLDFLKCMREMPLPEVLRVIRGIASANSENASMQIILDTCLDQAIRRLTTPAQDKNTDTSHNYFNILLNVIGKREPTEKHVSIAEKLFTYWSGEGQYPSLLAYHAISTTYGQDNNQTKVADTLWGRINILQRQELLLQVLKYKIFWNNPTAFSKNKRLQGYFHSIGTYGSEMVHAMLKTMPPAHAETLAIAMAITPAAEAAQMLDPEHWLETLTYSYSQKHDIITLSTDHLLDDSTLTL